MTRMFGLGAITAALFAGATIATPATAETREFKYSFNGGITSDYVFRGFSQTREKWTAQGGLDLSYGILYAGFWASGLDFGDDVTNGKGTFTGKNIAYAEVDLYAGIKPVWGKATFDFGVIYYTYPGARDKTPPAFTFADDELNYFEFKAGVSGTVWTGGSLGGTIYFSPEYTNATGRTVTLEGTFAQELPKLGSITPTFSVLVGHQIGDTDRYRFFVGNGDDSYTYWNAGLTLAWEKLSFDIRYWDTNVKNNNSTAPFGADNFCRGAQFQCDERIVGTVKFTY